VFGGLVTPRRVGIAVLSLVSLVVCCGLAYWQWTRFESVDGTWQNLGYVLQWPLFGLFPAFLFWRLRKLRRENAGEAAPEPVTRTAAAAPPPVPRKVRVAPPVSATVGQDGVDPEVAEYERFLATLQARERETP
jgi:DNA-binding transcriptional regulator of glucitol operon